jgi:O-antigen/teichoic acid export membrane protein
VTLGALARGSLFVTVANLVPRAATFLLLPIYARFLTQAEFGIVSLAGSAALLVAIACRLGMDAALLRLHYDVPPSDLADLYMTVAVLAATAVAAVTTVGAGVALFVEGPNGDAFPVWVLALAIAAVNTFQFIPSVWLRATDRPGRYLALALTAFGAVLAVTVALVVALRLGAAGSLAGQLAGATLAAVAAVYLLRAMGSGRWRYDLARRVLRFGLPLLPHALAGWLLNLSDRWLLGLLLVGPPAVALGAIGVYSLGYQLAYAIGLAAVSFNAAWLPFLYRVAQDGHARRVMREGTTLIIGGFTWLASAVAVLAPDLLGLIAPAEWRGAADVTTVAAIGFALQAASLVLASSFYLHRDTATIPLITFAAVGVNVAVNGALIPSLGIMGAAWATVAGYGALALLTGVVARRRHDIALDATRLVAVAVLAGLTVLGGRAIGGDGIPELAARVLLVVGSGGGTALLASGPALAIRRAVTDRPAFGDERTSAAVGQHDEVV